MNPPVSLCIYAASRVFLQYMKTRPDDTAARSSLQFIFSALGALKDKNPLAESFLVQLDVDIDGTPFSDQRPNGIISAKEKVRIDRMLMGDVSEVNLSMNFRLLISRKNVSFYSPSRNLNRMVTEIS